MSINCNQIDTSVATHLKSSFTVVDTDTVIFRLPDIYDIQVEVDDRLTSTRTPGSSMSITTAAIKYDDVEIIIYI